MLQPHFYFYLGFDEVIISELSFLREPSMPFHYDLPKRRPGQKCDHTGKIQKYMMCWRSTALHIPAGVEKVNEAGQRHVPIALYHAQSSLGKAEC